MVQTPESATVTRLGLEHDDVGTLRPISDHDHAHVGFRAAALLLLTVQLNRASPQDQSAN
jgi:hypothetical protein